MMCRYGGRFHDDEHSSDQCETLKDEGLHGCEQVVSRFSGLLECAAPNIASFLLGLEHIALQTSEEEPHQIRTVSMSYHMFHPVQNLGYQIGTSLYQKSTQKHTGVDLLMEGISL